MRPSLLFSLMCGSALCLAGCAGEKEAEAAHTSAAVSGRQEVVLRLAHAAEESSDSAGAEKLYKQVASQNPSSVDAQIELSDFYKRHHQESLAIDTLAETLKTHPGDAHAERALGNLYIGMGEPEKALTVLNAAVKQHERDGLLLNSRGVGLDQIGQYKEAQQSYKKALDIDPSENLMYKVNLSMSYILEGSYDRAITLLRPMLDSTSSPPITRQNLALAYGLKGDSESALKLGLQDLSTTEAEENIRFYRMLAERHQTGAYKHTKTAPVPASVIRELFPEQTPDDVPKPESGKPVVEDVKPSPAAEPAAPKPEMPRLIKPAPEPVIVPVPPAPKVENVEEKIPSPVIKRLPDVPIDGAAQKKEDSTPSASLPVPMLKPQE